MMAQPFSVFLMVQFMKQLPKELEESAMIDGANRWRTFWQIIMPLMQPAITAVLFLASRERGTSLSGRCWLLDTKDMYTLPVGLFQYKQAHFTEYNLLITSSMFNTIPVLISFFLFQRYFIEGRRLRR